MKSKKALANFIRIVGTGADQAKVICVAFRQENGRRRPLPASSSSSYLWSSGPVPIELQSCPEEIQSIVQPFPLRTNSQIRRQSISQSQTPSQAVLFHSTDTQWQHCRPKVERTHGGGAADQSSRQFRSRAEKGAPDGGPPDTSRQLRAVDPGARTREKTTQSAKGFPATAEWIPGHRCQHDTRGVLSEIGLYGRVAQDQARSNKIRECCAKHGPSLHPNGMRVFGLDAKKAMEVVPGIAFPACSSDVFNHAQPRRYSGENFTLEERGCKWDCRRVVHCGWACGHQPRMTPADTTIKSDILRLCSSGKKARYAGENHSEY